MIASTSRRFSAKIEFLFAYGVGLAKQIAETLIQIFELCQTKVVDEVALEKRVDSEDSWMGPSPLEPDVPTEMILSRSDRYKPAACLEYYPGLLRVYVNRTELADGLLQRLEQIADSWELAHKVFFNRMLPAGMGHVTGDKSLPAARTVPKGPFLFLCHSITQADALATLISSAHGCDDWMPGHQDRATDSRQMPAAAR